MNLPKEMDEMVTPNAMARKVTPLERIDVDAIVKLGPEDLVERLYMNAESEVIEYGQKTSWSSKYHTRVPRWNKAQREASIDYIFLLVYGYGKRRIDIDDAVRDHVRSILAKHIWLFRNELSLAARTMIVATSYPWFQAAYNKASSEHRLEWVDPADIRPLSFPYYS